jgi:hypothetical protein
MVMQLQQTWKMHLNYIKRIELENNVATNNDMDVWTVKTMMSHEGSL